VVPIDEQGRVTAFIEKPPSDEAPSHWINAGTYVLEPSVLARIAPVGRESIERVTFPAMVADGTLYGYQSEAYWIDTGTPESYVQAQLDLIAIRPAGAGLAAVDPSASVRGASVEDAVVMAGATVETGALVRRAVLQPGCRVAEDAVVDQAVIGPGAIVGTGAHVGGWSIVGGGVSVAPGEVLDGVRVPEAVP
jgi:mannose-1-phosphate guanylyltransferase